MEKAKTYQLVLVWGCTRTIWGWVATEPVKSRSQKRSLELNGLGNLMYTKSIFISSTSISKSLLPSKCSNHSHKTSAQKQLHDPSQIRKARPGQANDLHKVTERVKAEWKADTRNMMESLGPWPRNQTARSPIWHHLLGPLWLWGITNYSWASMSSFQKQEKEPHVPHVVVRVTCMLRKQHSHRAIARGAPTSACCGCYRLHTTAYQSFNEEMIRTDCFIGLIEKGTSRPFDPHPHIRSQR